MHLNYHFLRHFSQALAQNLSTNWALGLTEKEVFLAKNDSLTLLTIFSQSKDEIIFGFGNKEKDVYLRATLKSELTGLSISDSFARAKKNSVNLFPQLLDLKLQKIVQFQNERAFAFYFEHDFVLLFKLFGRRTNVILFQKKDIHTNNTNETVKYTPENTEKSPTKSSDYNFIIAFHKKMLADYNIVLEDLDRIIDQNKANFIQENGDTKILFPTFGKEINDFLKEKSDDKNGDDKSYSEKNIEEKWQIIQEILQQIAQKKITVFQRSEDKLPEFTLLVPPTNAKILYQSNNPLEASTQFFYITAKTEGLAKEKTDVLRELQRQQKQSKSYLQKNKIRLAEIDEASQYENIGHIIMANLHAIPPHIDKIELFDFFENKNRIITLKKDLSPQKNAENYYRKGKNAKIEIETLKKNLVRKETELVELEIHLAEIEKIDQIKVLRKYLLDNELKKQDEEKAINQNLFKKFLYKGFDIWVGKNAKNNDLLTQKYSYKEDLWLHAKDVSGSHVIIKYQAGKPFPVDVIEKAGSLAGYYSKRSTDTLCPVIVTPKKFVRKTKDLAPGQVIVEKEDVIMVVPEKF